MTTLAPCPQHLQEHPRGTGSELTLGAGTYALEKDKDTQGLEHPNTPSTASQESENSVPSTYKNTR